MSPPSHNSSTPKIMVFRPTIDEMKDFPAFISHIESLGAHKAGIAKIIPPKEFVAAYDYDKAETLTIPAPIQQEVMGHQGLYTQYNIQKKPLTFPEFRKLANSSRYATPTHFDYDDLERKYWKNITYNPPIYAADISGSLYSKGCDIWNINKLDTVLDVIEEEQGVKIEGVNTAYLYFGMWKTTFAWHTEDMDLYSINYLHFGAPKSWYGIPPEHAKRLERLASGFFPQSFQICPNFLRHKMTLISPQILKKYSIPYDKITQETGEFMITFPYGYHAGYNHGYNCAESTNFASLRWIDFGKRAKCCSCQRDSVKINMEPFIRIFQPQRYDAWRQGKDIVYIEDVDKPSSGIQYQTMMESQSPRKSQGNEVPLKTRRQPLHRKDGRRVQAPGTTNHRKRNHKGNTEEGPPVIKRGSPTVTIPIVKLEVGSLQSDNILLAHSGVEEAPSSSAQDAKDDIVVENEEPATKLPKLEVSSLPTPITSENSTPNLKKKKSKSAQGESKNKKGTHPKLDESSSNSRDLESKKQRAKSKKKHQKRSEENSKRKEMSKLKKNKKDDSMTLEVDAEQNHSDKQSDGSGTIDGLLKANGRNSKSHPDSSHNARKEPSGKTKEKSQKTGLLLEKEKAKLKKKTQKAASLKQKDGVNKEHAYSSFPSKTNGSTLHSTKAKPKKIKLDKLFEKSMKAKSNHTADKRPLNSTTSVDSTKVVQENPKAELTDKTADRKTAQDNSEESASKDDKQMKKAAAKDGKPKGKAKHDFTSQEFAAMKAWARSMNGLWVTQPHSYDMELAYNLSMADQRPGCCVCMLFYNEKIDGKNWESKSTARSSIAGADVCMDQRTFVLTPEMCFAATNEKRFPECMNDAVTAEGCSALLNCIKCKIAVHASCYGESVNNSDSWKCRRCQDQDYLAECCLCNLRGGALKRTTNGRWAHVVCAMAIPEVIFEDVKAREPININKISPARLKLKCFFCRPFIKMGSKCGGLIQCSVGRCALAFHVTCAQAAGVVMEPCDWPYAVYATCLRHPYSDKMRDNPRDYQLEDVCLGQTVIAKHKNSRYYKSEVVGHHQQAFYHVKFDDGSYSENLFPHDIENHDCVNDGPPNEGVAVTVRWTDGLVYKGTFVKSYMVKMHDVEFEDGSVSRVKREDIYCQEEALPKKVTTKLSTASDMRHENFLENEVVTERHRHVYSLYASSGSEPDEKTSINMTHNVEINTASSMDAIPDMTPEERSTSQQREYSVESSHQPQGVTESQEQCSADEQQVLHRTLDNNLKASPPAIHKQHEDGHMSPMEVFPEQTDECR